MYMKALIAMSGGVDSSVAAYLVKRDGYDCIGATMKLYENEVELSEKSCCSLDDVLDAKSVARSLSIPHYTFNLKADFKEKVISKFISDYESGATPNPCIECNRHLKFAALYDKARALGCDYIVTGHYAQIKEKDGKFHLFKAVDESKDQSYVLYSLTQELLSHILLPLGSLTKDETRDIAQRQGLCVSDKAESQDICFIPDGDYAAFIKRSTGRVYPEGDFVDTNGNVLGKHKGIINYTIGQRKGLGIALGAPAYVGKIDKENNRVVLCKNEELFVRSLDASDFNWISGEVPSEPVNCLAAVRYRGALKAATVIPTGEKTVHLEFSEPTRAATPGQAVVLYRDNEVLGGGTIN